VPLQDLLQQEELTFSDTSYEQIPLDTYVQHLCQRHDIRLALAQGEPITVKVHGYEFCEREHQSIKEMVLDPSVETTRKSLQNPPMIPNQLTKFSISPSRFPSSWSYISDWKFPDTLTQLDASLISTGRIHSTSRAVIPKSSLTSEENDENNGYDSAAYEDSEYSRSTPDSPQNKALSLLTPPSLGESLKAFDLQTFPPSLTALKIHTVIDAATQLPATLRHLSCVATPTTLTFLLLEHLPLQLESLYLSAGDLKGSTAERNQVQALGKTAEAILLARQFYEMLSAAPFGQDLLKTAKGKPLPKKVKSFERPAFSKKSTDKDAPPNFNQPRDLPSSSSFDQSLDQADGLGQPLEDRALQVLQEDLIINSWLEDIPRVVLAVAVCWMTRKLKSCETLKLAGFTPLSAPLDDSESLQSVLALATPALGHFKLNHVNWKRMENGMFEKSEGKKNSKSGKFGKSERRDPKSDDTEASPTSSSFSSSSSLVEASEYASRPTERAKHVHARGSLASLLVPCDPPNHRLDASLDDNSFSQLFSSEFTSTSCPFDRLRLYQNRFLSEASFRSLPSSLTILDVLENPNIFNETIAFLPRSLLHLTIGSTHLSDACISSLPPHLMSLDLRSQFISDSAIPMLPQSLVGLHLRNTNLLTDSNLHLLPSSLEKLSLTANTLMTDLGASVLPRSLKFLNLFSNNLITDKGMAVLPPTLTELWMPMNRQITDNCFASLSREIFVLCLSGISKVRPSSLVLLPPYLHRLHLDGASNLVPADLMTLPTTVARLRVTSAARASEEVVARCPLLHWDMAYMPHKR
jgi:hypothetical protein